MNIDSCYPLVEADDVYKNIRDQKLQYINREAAKTSVLSLDKIDEFEYLTVEEILLLMPSQVIKQTEFTYSSLGKAFEKQTKNWKAWKKKTSQSFRIFKVFWKAIKWTRKE